MTLGIALLVGVAGAAGAVCRAVLAHTVAVRISAAMPWGTWAVNLLGAFLFGTLLAMASSLDWPPTVVAPLGAGFLGAFTTFSTWMYETVRLIEEGAWRIAAGNVLGPVILGPPVVFAGAYAANSLISIWS